jgi:hypothetical protein
MQQEAKPTGSINATKDGCCCGLLFGSDLSCFLFSSSVCCKQEKNLPAFIKLGRLHSEYDDLHAHSAWCCLNLQAKRGV